jgi:hypothetical protein
MKSQQPRMENNQNLVGEKARKILIILTVSFIVNYLLLLFVPLPAAAIGRTVQIAPALIEVAAQPGSIEEAQITITNLSNDLVSLEGFVRDFVASPQGDAPRILGGEETSSYSLKNWLLLSQKSFILGPNEEKQITVTIAVPYQAEAGGHYGMVGFVEPNTTVREGVGVKAGVATLLFVTVQGELVEQVEVEQFAAGGLNLTGKITFSWITRNTGNIHVAPIGTIRITNLVGGQTGEIAANPEQYTVLPGSERTYTTTWHPSLPFGRYQATLLITLPSGQPVPVAPITFWVTPIRTVTSGIIALILLILLLYEYEHLTAHRRVTRMRQA